MTLTPNAKPILDFPSIRALAAHLGMHEINVSKRVKRLRARNLPITLEALRSPRTGRPRNEALDSKLHDDALFAELMSVAPVSLEVIAEAYGVSVECVRLIERNALARLRASRELLKVAS